MAVFVHQRPVVTQMPMVRMEGATAARDAGAPALAPALATETTAAADDKTSSGEEAVAPGIGYILGAAIAIAAGAWAGTWVYDNLAKAVSFTPPEGVGSFALFYIMQVFRGVILEGRGVPDVVVLVLVMAGFGLLYTVIAAAKFRFEDPKLYFGCNSE